MHTLWRLHQVHGTMRGRVQKCQILTTTLTRGPLGVHNTKFVECLGEVIVRFTQSFTSLI